MVEYIYYFKKNFFRIWGGQTISGKKNDLLLTNLKKPLKEINKRKKNRCDFQLKQLKKKKCLSS